jgi:hypothetical protein
MKRFDHVVDILDTAVDHATTIGAHGTFWRGVTRDQFIALRVRGKILLVPGNSGDSNIIKALRGLAPFGADLNPPPAGAIFERMPAGLPAVAADAIDFIAKWIDDGCPDDEMPAPALNRLLEVRAVRPPPVDLFTPEAFNTFFREFDSFFAFDSTPETDTAVGAFMDLAPTAWPGFVRTPNLNDWTTAIAAAGVKDTVRYLSDNQLRIIVKFFGNPADQTALNEAFWQFGKGTLPIDNQRPQDPKHQMNGALMWVMWLSCADASLRLGMKSDLWTQVAKAVALGLVGDALFRNRPNPLKITRYSKQDPNVQNTVTADFAKLSGNTLLDAVISLAREANFGAAMA